MRRSAAKVVRMLALWPPRGRGSCVMLGLIGSRIPAHGCRAASETPHRTTECASQPCALMPLFRVWRCVVLTVLIGCSTIVRSFGPSANGLDSRLTPHTSEFTGLKPERTVLAAGTVLWWENNWNPGRSPHRPETSVSTATKLPVRL